MGDGGSCEERQLLCAKDFECIRAISPPPPAGSRLGSSSNGRGSPDTQSLDGHVEIPIDLAEPGHRPRILQRLRQTRDRHVRKTPENRRSRLRAVVPAFQLQDAVHAGILNGGHGVAAYWYGKNKAFALRHGSSFDRNANSFLGWMNYGGGYDLYNELQNQSSDFPLRSR